MGAAGYIQQETVGRVDREQRGIALAPIGNAVEQAPVVGRILGNHGEIGIARACFGERKPGPEPKRRGGRIDGGEPFDIAPPAGDDQRARIRRRTLARDAVG